jgi:hypothetical protein
METTLEIDTTYTTKESEDGGYSRSLDLEKSPTITSAVDTVGGTHVRHPEGIALRIDTSVADRLRSEGAQSSATPPSATPFKMIWAQPAWKVVIFVAVVWFLNHE